MENLINLYSWTINKQNFLEIKDTDFVLSIVPENNHYYRDEKGYIHQSRKPIGLKLNCRVFLNDEHFEFVEFDEEKDFFNYLSRLQKIVTV